MGLSEVQEVAPVTGALEDLLNQARAADPYDRINLRDPIAAHGGRAIAALVPWLSDEEYVRFAILTIGAAGRAGAKEAAVAALRAMPRSMPKSELALAENELAKLGEKGGVGAGANEKIRQLLIAAAQDGRTVFYSDVAPMAELSMQNPHHRKLLGQLLGAISESEVINGRPMLSSIVVLKGEGGIHLGPGFSRLAEQLGLKSEGKGDDEFARAEVQRTFAYWKSHPQG
jgi:hypothetical protein